MSKIFLGSRGHTKRDLGQGPRAPTAHRQDVAALDSAKDRLSLARARQFHFRWAHDAWQLRADDLIASGSSLSPLVSLLLFDSLYFSVYLHR